jgi:hypothetical protein
MNENDDKNGVLYSVIGVVAVLIAVLFAWYFWVWTPSGSLPKIMEDKMIRDIEDEMRRGIENAKPLSQEQIKTAEDDMRRELNQNRPADIDIQKIEEEMRGGLAPTN